MSEYFTTHTDAATGETKIIPWTEEQIAARKARLAAMGLDKPPVPASITPRQCRLILAQQGLLDSVEAMIAQSTQDVRITWEYALEFRRDDPLLKQLAGNLGLTDEQIDQFFIAAAQL